MFYLEHFPLKCIIKDVELKVNDPAGFPARCSRISTHSSNFQHDVVDIKQTVVKLKFKLAPADF